MPSSHGGECTIYKRASVPVPLATNNAGPRENIEPEKTEEQNQRGKKKNRRLLSGVFLRGVAFAQRAVHFEPESQIKC